MENRHALTDKQWNIVKKFAIYSPKRGTKPNPDTFRLYLDGIFWILATGAPWRDLPPAYGPWQSVYSRFRAYIKNGILIKILTALQIKAIKNDKLELHFACFDGTYVKAHKHAMGARKKTN